MCDVGQADISIIPLNNKDLYEKFRMVNFSAPLVLFLSLFLFSSISSALRVHPHD